MKPDVLEIARNMAQSPDNWPPMRVKQVAEALLAMHRKASDAARDGTTASHAVAPSLLTPRTPPMSETELMPCPFCGGHAELCYFSGDTARVECRGDDCQMDEIYTDRLPIADAITAWNRRSPVAEGGGWREAIEAAAKVADERAKRLAEGGARFKDQGEHVAAYACQLAEAEAIAMAKAVRSLGPPAPS